MQNTNIVQGSFTSNGLPIILDIPMGIDWMEVYDYSQYGAAGSTPFPGLKYYWQLGMPVGTGLVEYKNTQTMSAALMTFGGFALIDTTQDPNNVTVSVVGNGATVGLSISAASPRVVTIIGATNAAALAIYQALLGFDQVRLSGLVGSTAALSDPLFGGKVWTYDTLAYNGTNTVTFNLSDTNTGTANAGTVTDISASLTAQKWSPYWYPRVYNVYQIKPNSTNSSYADVYTSNKPLYKTGQSVRFNVPKNVPVGTSWGMPQINGLVGNVVSVATVAPWSFTVDIDVSAFTAFNQPGSVGMPFTSTTQWVTVTPVGDVAAQIVDLAGNPIATNKFDESEFNQGFRGMLLGIGGTAAGQIAVVPTTVDVSGPAGVSGDVMYWKAGKSFSNQSGVLPNLPPFPPLGL